MKHYLIGLYTALLQFNISYNFVNGVGKAPG